MNIYVSLCALFSFFIGCYAINEQSVQTIEVINNSNQCLHMTANSPAHALRLDQSVPAHTKSLVISVLSKLSLSQDMLHGAILSDSAEKIRTAAHAGANINQPKDGKSPLLWAILLSRYNAIETLLHLGASIDDVCGEQAIKMQDAKSLLLLVKYGYPNLDIKKVSGIISLFINRNKFDIACELIRELINHGYNIDDFWGTAITLAYYNPNDGLEIIRFLLSRGANLNYMIGGCATPLVTAAAHFPSKSIVKILIESGADISQPVKLYGVRNGQFSTLLSYTIEALSSGSGIHGGNSNEKRREVIELLLAHGANL